MCFNEMGGGGGGGSIEYFLGLDTGNGMTALIHRSVIKKIGPTSPLDMNE